MALIVQKYGGTSVTGLERIRAVAALVIAEKKTGADVVVVVSAAAGETDRLLDMARAITAQPDGRELDLLFSSGERITSALLALALQALGYPARSFTGRQVGIITDSRHTKARIEQVTAERIREALQAGQIPVVAGFQGINERQEVTTLGRGGSDTTAVALAAALGAEVCDIYTDVDGVYTADPRLCPTARRLDRLSYEEMLEMASLGAKVLHTVAVEFAMRYNVPVRVRSSFSAGDSSSPGTFGTLITGEGASMISGKTQRTIAGVTADQNQAKITVVGVPDRPGIAAKLFGAVAGRDIVVDMIIQNVSREGLTDISFTVPQAGAETAAATIREVLGEVGARAVQVTDGIAKVSIVGAGMQTQPGVAAKMFATLAQAGINIMMISTSEIKISCIIDAKATAQAVQVLHEAFGLAEAAGSAESGSPAGPPGGCVVQ